MEEIVTVDGHQFRLTVDRPLTATERAQVLADIRKQTGCSSCHQPRTLGGGIYSLAKTCPAGTKASGEAINLQEGPTGGVGPYYVRFWRKPSAAGTMVYSEIGGTRTVAEGSTTGASFTLYDTDLVAASGDTLAGTPTTNASGVIADPGGGTAPLATGKIRVASTTYDSCPTGAQTCIEYCDVNLACVAPTCNFVVS